MKKRILFFGATALIMTVSCSKTDLNDSICDNTLTITATVEQQFDDTKTILNTNDRSQILWQSGDLVRVYDVDGTTNAVYTTTSDGTTTADFTKSSGEYNELQDGDLVIYPSDKATGHSGSSVTFTMPNVQSFTSKTFSNGSNVAVGVYDKGHVDFKNACGIFRLLLKGSSNFEISKVLISDNDGKELWGKFSIDAANVGDGATYVSGGGTILTLNCGDRGKGTYLTKTTTGKSFYAVVPSGVFAHGFTAMFFDAEGHYIQTLKTDKANTILRSTIQAMPLKILNESSPAADGLTETVVESVLIDSVNPAGTGKKPTVDSKVEVCFSLMALPSSFSNRHSIPFGVRTTSNSVQIWTLCSSGTSSSGMKDYFYTRYMGGTGGYLWEDKQLKKNQAYDVSVEIVAASLGEEGYRSHATMTEHGSEPLISDECYSGAVNAAMTSEELFLGNFNRSYDAVSNSVRIHDFKFWPDKSVEATYNHFVPKALQYKGHSVGYVLTDGTTVCYALQ